MPRLTKTSISVASSAVVAATAGVAMVAAAVIAVVQAGQFFFPQTRWRFSRAHRTSPLEYPRLLDVAAAPKAAVLGGADLCSRGPLVMLHSGCRISSLVRRSGC